MQPVPCDNIEPRVYVNVEKAVNGYIINDNSYKATVFTTLPEALTFINDKLK